MIYQSKDDHVKYGFNKIHKSFRQSNQDEWFVDFGKCTRRPKNFFDEMILSVQDIRQKTDKTLYFLLSGGVDSEMMANAALASKVENIEFLFTSYNGKNIHDFYYANKWAKSNNIDMKIYNFDALTFFKSSEIKFISKNIRSVVPQMVVYGKILEYVSKILNGFPIAGAGDFMVLNTGKQYVTWKREKIFTPNRFLDFYSIEGIPSFFQYSPELILSWYYDFIEFDTKQKLRLNENSYRKIRYLIYSKYKKDLELRVKYHGFEFLIEPCWEIRKWMFETFEKQFNSHCNDNYVTPLPVILSRLINDNI